MDSTSKVMHFTSSMTMRCHMIFRMPFLPLRLSMVKVPAVMQPANCKFILDGVRMAIQRKPRTRNQRGRRLSSTGVSLSKLDARPDKCRNFASQRMIRAKARTNMSQTSTACMVHVATYKHLIEMVEQCLPFSYPIIWRFRTHRSCIKTTEPVLWAN